MSFISAFILKWFSFEISINFVIPVTDTSKAVTSNPFFARKIESLPVGFWDKHFLAYSNSIVGIHAPFSQVQELQKLYNIFVHKHNIYKFLCIMNGGGFTATAYGKQEIDELPHPDDVEKILVSFWDEILSNDILKYMTEYIRRGQNSKLLTKDAKDRDIQEYSDTFIKMLGSIYKNLKASDPIFLDGLICQPFYFGDKPELDWLDENAEEVLEKLIYFNDRYERLRTIRVVRFYDKNVFIIIKPDRLRYWIRSTAIWDADETLTDLYNQGY